MSVIAISRGSLTVAEKLSKALGERLGSRVISREDVITAAEKYGIDKTGISRENIAGEFPPGFWERYSTARHHYLACFKAALLDFVVKEPVIYHGNLAHVLLDEVPFVLRVRVNAPRENRVKMLMEERGYTRGRAAAEVREMDKRRRRWIQFLYDAEYLDPIAFDLVMNMRRMTIQDAVDLIANEIKKEPFQRTEASVKEVFDQHLATIAEVNLLHNHETYSLGLRVDSDSAAGKVIVYKNAALDDESIDEEIRRVLEALEQVKEVDIKVDSDL